jgi:thioredoxin-like negative regulator of GroEL
MTSIDGHAQGFRWCPMGISIGVATVHSDILVLLVTKRTSGVGRRMESVLARLQVRERGRIRVGRVDADDRPDLVERLGVDEIPSIVMLEDRKPFARLRGRATLGDVERLLSQRIDREGAEAATG